MPIVTQPVPNLINGVSQQPVDYRLPNQADVCTNCWPSVVEGLKRRPGSRNISRISEEAFEPYTMVHYLDRSPLEKYMIVVRPAGVLKAYNLVTGEEATINDLEGADYTYITTDNPKADMRALSLSDSTFLLNRTKKVTLSSDRTDPQVNEALVWIKQATAIATENYKVTIKDSGGNTNTYTAASDDSSQALVSSLESSLTPDWDVSLFNHVLRIRPKTDGEDIVSIETSDPLSGTGLKACFTSVDSLQDLPDSAPDGFKIKVRGELAKAQDDFYVTFETSEEKDAGEFGRGSWEETVGWDVQYRMDTTTMPQRLISTGFNTFSYGPAEWADRVSGDGDTLEAPSFVGETLNGLTFFENRMVLLADINVILSESGEYTNFWATTSLLLPDTDPVDITVNTPRISPLEYAVPFSRRLILFTKEAQFALYGVPVVTASTVAAHPVTAFAYTGTPEPVAYGRFLYFGNDRSEYFQAREYFLDRDGETYDAIPISGHIPSYIPSGVKYMAASSEAGGILFVPEDDGSKLYFYKTYWQDDKKVQSAWFDFDFPGVARVVGATFIQNILYAILVRGTATYLEALEFTDDDADTGFPYTPYLDRRVPETECSVVYSSFSKESTITFPAGLYEVGTEVSLVGTDGTLLKADSDGTSVVFSGDWTSDQFFIGINFTSSYRLPRGRVRDPENGDVIDGLKTNCLHVALRYEDSGEFRMVMERDRRTTLSEVVGTPVFDEGNPADSWELITREDVVYPSVPIEDLRVGVDSHEHLPFNALSITYRIRVYGGYK